MLKFILDLRNKDFMRLWWGQLISQFGDRVNQMALIGLIAEIAPGSTLQLAKLLSFTIIPVFFVGPIAGVYVDRWDRRRTLFTSDFIRGILVLSIPLVFMQQQSMVPIYIVVFLMFCCSRFHVPAKMCIIPDLVDKKNLMMANSLITTTGMVAFVMGCSVGGFIVDRFGARTGFLIDAATFFISGLLVFIIPDQLKFNRFNRRAIMKAGREMIADFKKSIFTEMKEGIQYLVNHREIRFIIAMLFILLAAAGAIYVVIIVFIQQSFQSITKDLGILAVFLGSGLFIGAILYGRFGKRFIWYKTIFCCLIVGGFMVMLFAWAVQTYPSLKIATFLALGMGIVVGPIFIAANTMIHVVTDASMRGKVFSTLEIVIHFAFLAALFVSSTLSEFIPRIWILTGVGGIFILVGLLGFVRYRNGKELAIGH